MAVKAEIKIQGIEQLQKRLLERKARIENFLNMRLRNLAVDAITYSKEHKGYKDHTSNLKNTISFALFKDGELVTRVVNTNKDLPKEHAKEKISANEINSRLMEYAKDNVRPTGYTLIIVAPMNYAKKVETEGYNVLFLTRHYLRKEMEEILRGIINE